MDDELFKRFLNGEPAATTGVKNHLRAITSRVLAAPQWSLKGAEQTRALEIQAAKEAMASPGDTVLTCATGALLASTNLGLIALRSREALPKGHPDSLTVAREVVGVLGEPDKGALLEHMEQCGTCNRHFEMAKGAVNAAFSASASQQSARMVPEPTKKAASGRHQHATAPKTQKSKKKAAKKPTHKDLHPDILAKRRYPIISSLMPLFILVVILGYFGYSKTIETADERLRRLANLISAEIPPTALADDMDPSSRGAALDMRRGHCASAAPRLGVASDNNPSDATLTYYAGLAHLCARHAEQSLRYFERLNTINDEPFYGQKWWYTQALILNNRTAEARVILSIIVEDEHPRANSAVRQLARLDDAGI